MASVSKVEVFVVAWPKEKKVVVTYRWVEPGTGGNKEKGKKKRSSKLSRSGDILRAVQALLNVPHLLAPLKLPQGVGGKKKKDPSRGGWFSMMIRRKNLVHSLSLTKWTLKRVLCLAFPRPFLQPYKETPLYPRPQPLRDLPLTHWLLYPKSFSHLHHHLHLPLEDYKTARSCLFSVYHSSTTMSPLL